MNMGNVGSILPHASFGIHIVHLPSGTMKG